ncbi:lysozyme [Sphingomonas sp. PB2P19]|uniref:lysozyme n=1 Tax=Sphingomonas rhamnosi TaxID=3096156 RepID=UPI002FCB0065
MNISSRAGLGLVKISEGCRLTAYLDPASGGAPWTIGYGRTTGVKPGQTCTQAQADAWIVEEYDGYEADVRKLVKVPITANMLGALTSFAYNLGVGALKGSTLLKKLNAGDYAGAAAQFARWNMAAGKAMAGLTKRRAAEAALFLK